MPGETLESWGDDGWIIVTAYHDSHQGITHYLAKRLKKNR